MKVLIVDDETDVRDSIRLLVHWGDFQITDVLEACDGAAAMELIRSEQPEIIFTDMKMPNVDGLTLLQWIGDNAPESKRIVISGYSDYTYIRKTMRHGGLDYLLKPINRNELLEALRNAVDTWLKDDEARRQNIRRDVEINKTLPMYWDKMLSGVVSQPDGYWIVADELQASFEWSAVRECQLVMLISDPLPRTVLEKFGRNIDLLYFLILNICNEIISPSRNGYAFRHADPNYGILLLMTGDFGGNSRKLTAINEALYRVLRARFHLPAAAGSHSRRTSTPDFGRCCRQPFPFPFWDRIPGFTVLRTLLPPLPTKESFWPIIVARFWPLFTKGSSARSWAPSPIGCRRLDNCMP